MADGERWTGSGVGPIYLGRTYEEVGPELGRLHAAWHANTGQPLLLFMPGDRVEWQLEGNWGARIRCQSNPPAVMLFVDQAPESADFTELMDSLTLMTAAGQRAEENPLVAAHLAAPPVATAEGWRERVRRALSSRGAFAAAGCVVLMLGLDIWVRLAMVPREPMRALSAPASADLSHADATHLTDTEAPGTETVTYPLPTKPFRNQAAAPCKPKLDEVEINSGCWVELARRPPCIKESQAEYQGKCYLPVSKDRGAKPSPQSAEP